MEKEMSDVKQNNNDSVPPTAATNGKPPVVKATQHATRKARAAGGARSERNAKRAKANEKKKAARGAAPKAAAKTEKATDPKLVKVVLDHAENNKGRNGWDKVLRWNKDMLHTLLAGAKTENAAIKRTRAKLEAK
jgi:hypothetical protein